MARNSGLLMVALLLVACQEQTDSSSVAVATTDTGRWYSTEQLEAGAAVFSAHCASCHGEQAQGLAEDWRQRLEDGNFPPPPLNGSAHAWHHPLSVLLQVINEGGVALGGQMPGFAEVLNDNEQRSAIAYFQSFWTDEIYEQWQQMGGIQ